MSKVSIKTLHDVLEGQRDTYKSLSHQLRDEQQLAKAESSAAREALEPVLAGFVARLVPDFAAPAYAKLDEIVRTEYHVRSPGLIKLRLERQGLEATAKLTDLTEQHGPLPALKEQVQATDNLLTQLQTTTSEKKAILSEANEQLGMLDHLNDRLQDKGYRPITADKLEYFAKPEGTFAQMARWATDGAYRMARPVLDSYTERGINLGTKLVERIDIKTELDDLAQQKPQLIAAQTLTQQQIRAQEQQIELQRSPGEILREVRGVITDALLDRKTFLAAKQAFPAEMPHEAEWLSLRMDLMGKLADGIGQQKQEAEQVSDQLNDPLSKLAKAVRNRKGSKEIDFDLDDKAARMTKHQKLLGQRLTAARDIRSAAHSAPSRAADSGSDINTFLLWYLILSDTGPAQAATPAFQSGGGGDFGGGGAGGSWDEKPADNSYFRAELLGINPSNAKEYGLDAGQLRVAPETLRDLGVASSDFKGTDFSGSSFSDDNRGAWALGAGLGAGLGVAGSTAFNELSGGLDFDTRKLDFGNLGSEIGSSVSSISSEISSSSGWSSSYDSGSSYSSPSYDSGGSSSFDSGGSSSSFD